MVIQPYCMHPYSLYSASSDLLHSDSVQTISSWSFNPIVFTHTAFTVLVSFIAFRLSTDYFLMVIQPYCIHPYSLNSASSALLHSDSVQTISSWSFNPIAFTHTALTVLVSCIAFRLSTDYFLMVIQPYCIHPYSLNSASQLYCIQTQYRLFSHGHSTLLHSPIQP